MFQSAQQHAAVCAALCARLGPSLPPLWSESGPTRDAVQYLQYPGTLSPGQYLLLRVAWDVWDGTGEARLDRLLAGLDHEHLRAVGSLLVALADPSGRAIDAWLRNQRGA